MRLTQPSLVIIVALASAAAVLPASAAPAAKSPVVFKDCTAALGLKLGTDAACWVDFGQ